VQEGVAGRLRLEGGGRSGGRRPGVGKVGRRWVKRG
jgi:hypothetical protein